MWIEGNSQLDNNFKVQVLLNQKSKQQQHHHQQQQRQHIQKIYFYNTHTSHIFYDLKCECSFCIQHIPDQCYYNA